jgi:hypothetical protein
MQRGTRKPHPTMLPAEETPAEGPTAVWRRAELVVEREVITVHYPGGSAVVGECPKCGHEVLIRDVMTGPAIDLLKNPNP